MTNIIGFVHLLGEPSTGPLAPKQREYLDFITVRPPPLALINKVLDLATIDAGRMQLNLGNVDIRATMELAAEGVQDRLVSAGIKLDIRAAAQIGSFVADERRLRQILFNLLANAVSFTRRRNGDTGGGTQSRRSHVLGHRPRARHSPRSARKSVRLVRVAFARLAASRPGIGLSLVRSFVELHGGTVAIASVVGQGTTVTCTFPLGEAATLSAA